jgi:hypothetical protein
VTLLLLAHARRRGTDGMMQVSKQVYGIRVEKTAQGKMIARSPSHRTLSAADRPDVPSRGAQ